ncbi:MAG: TorF family putative porin [Parcubacteria group bacterium]
MKRILGVSIVAALVVLFVSGVASAEVNIDYSVQIWSKYLTCSGWDVSNGKSLVESDVSISNGTGFRLEFWNAKPFEGDFDTPGNETDVIGGLRKMIPGTKIMADVGLAYFILPGHDTGEFFLQLSREFKLTDNWLSVAHGRIELNYGIGGQDVSQNTYWGGGLVWHINPNLCWNAADATIVTDNGGASHAGEILLLQSSLTYKYSEALNFTIGLKNTNPFDGADVDRKKQVAMFGGIGGIF